MATQGNSWHWLHEAADVLPVTLDSYLGIPEELSRRIEVVDGMVVTCESPSQNHQGIAQALVSALQEATRKHDARRGTCHRVRGEPDVLLTEVPFSYRRPDAVVYRCLPEDRRGKWRNKPYAMDVIIAVEIVSPNTRTVDRATKRIEYAEAGIPHYWIIEMAEDDGPAFAVERLRLQAGRHYGSEGTAYRGKDLLAVDAVDPFGIKISWEQLDEWL